MMYFKRRFIRAIKVSYIILFGKYVHSGWDGHSHHVTYKYKGKEYKVPDLFRVEEKDAK